MKKRNLLLCIGIITVICCLQAGNVWAYFTANTHAKGELGITIDTDITEKVVDKEKRVTISNNEESDPVYVRVRGFSGDDSDLQYSGELWSGGEDGWWYYDAVLEAGKETTELLVNIEKVIPADAKPGDSFNVVVVYEAVPVQYGEDGALPADWTVLMTE